MSEPVQVGELLPGVLQEVIDRAGPGYDRWVKQVAATGYCAHPVRLRGRVEQADAATGEVRTVYDTDREPDATLLKACGNRRASVCPSCSATYQADQFHLLAAGLRGGKGVPETVVTHPRLFVTFTAPSFGRVHSRRAQGLLVFPCHPYRQGQTCPHGRRAGCWQRHDGGMTSTKEQDRRMDRLLTWDEAAERLNTTPRHVRRLVFERRIAYRKLGRYVRFHPDDLEEYITGNRVEVGGAAGSRPVVVVWRRRS